MTVGMRVSSRTPHPAAQVLKESTYKRTSVFLLWSRDYVPWPYSGGTATVVTGHYVSIPSFRERGLRM